MDEHESEDKAGTPTRQEGHKLNWKIKCLLREDMVERAQWAGEAITLFRAEGEEKESWKLAKGWYRQVTERPSKPYHRFMTRQTKEREELYTRWEPPGDPTPCSTARPPLEDGTRLDAELWAAVKKLCSGRAEGGSTMWAEDLKAWLKGMEQEEKMADE